MSTIILPNNNPVTTELVIDEITTIINTAGTGVPGAAGPPGEGAAIKLNFSYGDATPALILTTTVNLTIFKAEVILLTPFNGTPSTLTIGDSVDNSRIFKATDIDLTSIGTYETNPNVFYTGITNINLYLTLGAGVTTGNGIILLYTT